MLQLLLASYGIGHEDIFSTSPMSINVIWMADTNAFIPLIP